MSPAKLRCLLTVESILPSDLGHIPFSPLIDFGALIKQAATGGVLDVNSIEVLNLITGTAVEYGRSEDFAYGDKGRLEWAITHPSHTQYEVRFTTAPQRPPLTPQPFVPLVGVGDLLRYNAGVPRPIVLQSANLVDLRNTGQRDLVGCWNYYHRPGAPISGLVYYPRSSKDESLNFGDMARLRYVEARGDTELKHFPGVYISADFADFSGDGLIDIVFAEQNSNRLVFFLNTGRCDAGGQPIFVRDATLELPFDAISNLQALDLDGDGRLDLVVNGHYIHNDNPAVWPFSPADPVDLGAGDNLTFLDLDGDGILEMLALGETGTVQATGRRPLNWYRQTRASTLSFGAPTPIEGISALEHSSGIRAVNDSGRHGLLVQSDTYQKIIFYQLVGWREDQPHFVLRGPLESLSAVASWSDQAWPCLCDWNNNGVWDLLIGGGYGWPRIVLNRGTNQRPALSEPQLVLSEGEPIRILRDDLLHSKHWHNMGYPYPVFVDWDGDGLKDLLLPNETNRIVWYKNIGTVAEPRFGPRQYIAVEGFADSQALRAASGRDAEDKERPNHPYPTDERSPFFWRTGAAFADWNGDGLMDFITHDHRRRATLFAQYKNERGELKLRLEGPVYLEDGRLVDDAIVGRTKHWTESFRAVDWDGDGRMDLVYNLAGSGEIYLLRNVGTQQNPLFAAPRQMKCYGEPIAFTVHGPNAWAGDFNGDGKPDLLGCVEWSLYPFYAHAALEMEAHPQYRVVLIEQRSV